jgi:hypothetical protein
MNAMPLFLITSVCDEGVSATSFKVVEAESRLSIAQHILDHPHDWERMLRHTKLWWDLTSYPYKYGESRGWTAADLLSQIDATHVDGDSSYQFRIHEITAIERVPANRLPETARPAPAREHIGMATGDAAVGRALPRP